MEKIDLIASGYEWICPKCNQFNKEIEVPGNETVKCEFCLTKYKVADYGHAIG